MERGEDAILPLNFTSQPTRACWQAICNCIQILAVCNQTVETQKTMAWWPCWCYSQKEPMRNLLFMTTNMATMTPRANLELNEHQARMSAYAHAWNKDKVP